MCDSYMTPLFSYLSCLGSQYRGLVKIQTIGRSSQGQPLKVAHISSGGGGGGNKPAIFIDGGIHAREWISPATVTYLVREFVENSAKYSSILSKADLYILPLLNPDGYSYSRSKDRLWRKNRAKNKGTCSGVDLNRNFGYKWGGAGSSGNPCEEHYRGPRAFSEPESRALRDFLLARKGRVAMYLTFHSYGQMILYPWGYDNVRAKDRNELHRMGRIGAAAMGRAYKVRIS